MKAKIQVYLTNAVDVLQYNAEPFYTLQGGGAVSSYLTGEAGYIHLGEVEIDHPEAPSREVLTVRTVAAMKEEVQRIRAKAESAAQNIELQINDLLMIGHDSHVSL